MLYNLSLDHLELYFLGDDVVKDKYSFVKEINTTNTSAGYIDYIDNNGEIVKFSYKVVNLFGYRKGFGFSFVYNDYVVEAFHIAFGGQNGAILSNNKITFYSSFMLIYGNDWVYDFIQNFFNTEYFGRLKRFDIALDLPQNKERLIDSFKTKPTSNLNLNEDTGEYETIYFGKRKNKTVLLRIYDKILDTVKKGKSFLYDFQGIDDMTRLELEFGSQFIKAVNHEVEILTYGSLLMDIKTLRDLFFSKIGRYTDFFSSEYFCNNYKMQKIPPKIDDLQKYYLEYKKLPKWHRNRIKGMKKVIDTIGLMDFLNIIYDNFNDKSFYKFLDDIREHLTDKNQIKIRKKMALRRLDKELYKDKLDFIEKVSEYLFGRDFFSSDDMFLQLEYTFSKHYKK